MAFYTHGGVPSQGSTGSSAEIRAELDSIAASFVLLGALTADRAIVNNSAGTARTVTAGTLSLPYNFAIAGAGITLTATGTTNVTLPTSGTLLTTTGSAAGLTSFPTLNQNTTGSAASCTGNAATVTTNANLTGDVTSVGNATTIGANKVTLGMLATGTAGNLITYSADGAPAAVATGTAAQVLTSNGAGAAPTFQATTSTTAIGTLTNATFTVTVALNALTIALKTKAGTDPSATDPVSVSFRPASLTSGLYVTRTITAAMSLVVPDTATLGTVNATPARLYIGLQDNAGTVGLTIHNPLTVTGLFGANESDLHTTTSVGVGSDSAGVIYTTTGAASLPYRIIGYIEIQEATAGTWATAPTVLQLMGPGVRRTGDVVQIPYTNLRVMSTYANATPIPEDNTIPQNTEGDQIMTLTMTTNSALNRLQFNCCVQMNMTTAVKNVVSIFQDEGASAIVIFHGDTNGAAPVGGFYEMAAATASSTTFKLRVGGASGTTTVNGFLGVSFYGGAENSYLRITEIFQ